MAILDIAKSQKVLIPSIRLTNGRPFSGVVKVSDGETLVIEVSNNEDGLIPERIDEMCVLNWDADGMQRSCPLLVRSRSSRNLVGQVVIQERREAPRIRADVQIVYEIIPPDHVRDIADEVMTRVNTLSQPESETIQLLRKGDDPMDSLREELMLMREMMGEILNRVESLENRLMGIGDNESRVILRPLSVTNLSGTGLGMIVREPHSEGDYMRLRLTLRTVPQTIIDCVGVIVRCTGFANNEADGQTSFDLGVRFTHIHEIDRERMIQYLFKIQRRILRDRREARDAIAETNY